MFLCFLKSNVFVSGGSAYVTDPCQFQDIQLLAHIGGIVKKERCGDVLFAHLRLPALQLTPAGTSLRSNFMRAAHFLCRKAHLVEKTGYLRNLSFHVFG